MTVGSVAAAFIGFLFALWFWQRAGKALGDWAYRAALKRGVCHWCSKPAAWQWTMGRSQTRFNACERHANEKFGPLTLREWEVKNGKMVRLREEQAANG